MYRVYVYTPSTSKSASHHLPPSTIYVQQRPPLCLHPVALRAGPGIQIIAAASFYRYRYRYTGFLSCINRQVHKRVRVCHLSVVRQGRSTQRVGRTEYLTLKARVVHTVARAGHHTQTHLRPGLMQRVGRLRRAYQVVAAVDGDAGNRS